MKCSKERDIKVGELGKATLNGKKKLINESDGEREKEVE